MDRAEDDATRRQREISMFSAMASGGTFHELPRVDETKESGSEEIDMNSHNGAGTFAVKRLQEGEAAAKSNLDAAAESLLNEEKLPHHMPPLLPTNFGYPGPTFTSGLPKVGPIPMYMERVNQPRPLFFGPIIPPRVLKEARQIVSDALDELDMKGETPRLDDMPPEVRNLVSVMATFGFRLSLLKDSSSESGSDFWRGDPYVSTYHPVWGELTRLEREQMRRQQADYGQSADRSMQSTATGEKGRESESPISDAGQPTSGEIFDFGMTPLVPNTAPDTGSATACEDTPAEHAEAPSSEPQSNSTVVEQKKTGITRDTHHFSQLTNENVDSPTFPIKRAEVELNNTSAARHRPADAAFASQALHMPDKIDRGTDSERIDKDLFSQWALGAMPSSPTALPVSGVSRNTEHSPAVEVIGSHEGSFHRTNSAAEGQPTVKNASEDLSEKETFAKWVRGEEHDGLADVPIRPFDTFSQVKKPANEDSDDDSVVGSELKKKVGINEHLDAAVASLAYDTTISRTGVAAGHGASESFSPEESSTLLSYAGAAAARGRPLSNLEFTGGCVPLFACDDGSLPIDADLEIFQTHDEQLRYQESCRSEEIIDKHTLPNLFGVVACPNPSFYPEDSQRWNCRTDLNRRPPDYGDAVGVDLGGPGVLPVPLSPAAKSRRKHRMKAPSPSTVGTSSVGSGMDDNIGRSVQSGSSIGKDTKTQERRPKSKSSTLNSGRVWGWWNAREARSHDISSNHTVDALDMSGGSTAFTLPRNHATPDDPFATRLYPSPEKLRKDNLPLSSLHSAFHMEQALPFLSDRPPSYRYLQIDTQVVGFPAVDEIEPLFCSLAVYHVEPLPGRGQRAVPMPNLQRCGRITEVLNFDVVSDPGVERQCAQALWPYSDASDDENARTQSTRCGVFPLPSNFSIANLYAILIVQKVLSDGADLEPYLRENKGGSYDFDKLRSRAAKAAIRRGQFLMPFCFGVAPLVQVLGTDIPTMARSRAVQIPLFHLVTGQGDRPIINQIMVMLNPKGEFSPVGRGDRAANSNGGTAFFVMRNFGYLGLHSVVHGKSSLARDRLVDFTGEMQIRGVQRKLDNENEESYLVAEVNSASEMNYTVPPWHGSIVPEATTNGGRIMSDRRQATSGSVTSARSPTSSTNRPFQESQSKVYAQELGSVPLQLAPGAVPPISGSNDIEPFIRTTFCNELLCYPRVLQNGPKGCITIKVEFRELEWNDVHQAYLARLPRTGPNLHNPRRGAFLVQDAYTSCAVQTANPQFVDEFKFKLPLVLDIVRNSSLYALVFSVCHVHIRPRKSWVFGRRGDEEDRRSKVDVLACGFLPITTTSDNGCLLDNGLHDVKIAYSCRPLPPVNEKGTLVLKKLPEVEAWGARGRAEDGTEEAGAVVGPTGIDGEMQVVDTDEFGESSGVGSESALSETNTESGVLAKQLVSDRGMVLQVRLVANSTVHPQSATLSEFFRCAPDGAIPLSSIHSQGALSQLKFKRNDLLAHIRAVTALYESEPFTEALQKLHVYAIDVSNTAFCSLGECTAHFFRLVSQLLKTMLLGDGKSPIIWANPASLLSLRIQSFASLIQILHSVNNYMEKSRVKRLDMRSNWRMTELSRIVALMTDEDSLVTGWEKEALPEVFNFDDWLLHNDSVANKVQPNCPVRIDDMKSQTGFLENDSSSSFESIEDFLSNFRSEKPIADETGGLRDKADILRARIEKSRLSAFDSDEQAGRMAEVRIDTKADFQSALRLGSVEESSASILSDTAAPGSNNTSNDRVGTNPGRRKYMTMPASTLSTIREVDDATQAVSGTSVAEGTLNASSPPESHGEVIMLRSASSVKKMRVPLQNRAAEANNSDAAAGFPNDEQIVQAGNAFLDSFGEGYEPGVRRSHSIDWSPRHRKRRSLCSLDWASSDLGQVSDGNLSTSSLSSRLQSGDLPQPIEVLLDDEERNSAIPLPSFVDRLIFLGKCDVDGKWCPYIYEVLIFQWVALLDARRAVSKQKSRPTSHPGSTGIHLAQETSEVLENAAGRVRRATVECAPALFELIKQSIGCRIASIFRVLPRTCSPSSVDVPPLARLDESILGCLEHLICMVTDACLDVRNFDSQKMKQKSIEVNDFIIRFLIDLFALLESKTVHRLILVYLSRFVVQDGTPWQDRESEIGSKCSHEVLKLRMNAVTALVRFPDFVYVNSPQVEAFGASVPANLPRDFFDGILDRFMSLCIPGFATNDGPVGKTKLNFPPMQPHWLVELVTDICLSGTDHVEQTFQHRASSLLHELFWTLSQEAQARGKSQMVASMFVPFFMKLLWHVRYWSSFQPKSQLRRDLLPCALYVLQSAPARLMRAVWRKLLPGLTGKGSTSMYGGIEDLHVSSNSVNGDNYDRFSGAREQPDENSPDILHVFSLLNLALATFEYEGSEKQIATELGSERVSQLESWKSEFILALDHPDVRVRRILPYIRRLNENDRVRSEATYSTTASRRWFSHDASIVVITTCRQISSEMFSISGADELNYSFDDTVIFVRGVTSVYLKLLTLHQSDISAVRALEASKECLSVFGIDIFLRAVGETLQHWMRVVSFHCGARRKNVRIASSDFLGHLLRRTWDSLGSFTRIRVPLLSVQVEAMERIVATSARRYYREQQSMGIAIQLLGNDSAEASLSLLWRTLDRFHHQSASQNSAFRSALIRLAEKMKKLYRAYIAAHALIILNRASSGISPMVNLPDVGGGMESPGMAQSRRIIVRRIVQNSAGYCWHFVGREYSASKDLKAAHYEAIEDAFLQAAHVFSPSELPQFRVAWLRRLAELHSTRSHLAEEAMCRYHICLALKAAFAVHQSLWSSAPFAPWTVDADAGFHVMSQGDMYDPKCVVGRLGETDLGRQMDRHSSFRRVFYRYSNSIRMRTGESEIGDNKSLFCGVTRPSDFSTFSPWLTPREIKMEMVEEAELSGERFLEARITESSRYMWALAAKEYAERFDYEKLAFAYKRLATVMSPDVPVIDTNHQSIELSHTLGRFFKLYFHGGAPDELIGQEYVFRAGHSVKLDQVGEEIRVAIRSILPELTPLNIQLDDGRHDQTDTQSTPRRPLGPNPADPMKVRITPLRALQKNGLFTRGTAEWFYAFAGLSLGSFELSPSIPRVRSKSFSQAVEDSRKGRPGHRYSNTRTSSRFTSSGSSSGVGSRSRRFDTGILGAVSAEGIRGKWPMEGDELVGVDTFCFVHAPSRSGRASRDWLKPPGGDICLMFLNKRFVGVERLFPACGTRQKISFRRTTQICSLEAGLDAVCSWCSVLFRTAVATNGDAVLGGRLDQGIGNSAVRIISESIHRSRVREIGLVLLQGSSYVVEDNESSYSAFSERTENRIDAEKMKTLQTRLARCIVLFIEILHLLIGRNRDLLLEAMPSKNGPDSVRNSSFVRHANNSSTSTPEAFGRHSRFSSGVSGMSSQGEGLFSSDMSANGLGASTLSGGRGNDQTEKAKTIHRELQRSFASMVKALHSNVATVLGEETPPWLKQACNENYFKLGKKAKLRMSNELSFPSIQGLATVESADEEQGVPVHMVMSVDQSGLHGRESSDSFHDGSVRSFGITRTAPSPVQSGDSSLFQV